MSENKQYENEYKVIVLHLTWQSILKCTLVTNDASMQRLKHNAVKQIRNDHSDNFRFFCTTCVFFKSVV